MKFVRKLGVLLLALCLLLAMTACGGSKALTKEEYEDAVTKLGDDFTAIQNEASNLNMDDLDQTVKLLEDAKAPLQEFMALTPPDVYAGAHEKLSSGSQAMADYIDVVIAMVNETDLNQIQQQAQEMLELLQTASQNLTEGAALLEEAAEN